MDSKHSTIRAQQRGFPPFIGDLLDAYGHEAYDGHGGLKLYFDKRSRRQMERDMGREPVRLLERWLDCYKVLGARDGGVITIGHRHRRIRRA